jgi:hypothetical protein
MFAEPPLGIHRAAAGTSLSIDNIVAIFCCMMNCIITNHILGNFVMSTVFKFNHPIDDADKLNHEQVAQDSYVNVVVKQVKVMCECFQLQH